ncbi:hypothetical protein [Arthrobacter sp. 3Tela_A]|uniref:hypothetical protein n=1 Tax=Arthrobacter sp. 3Tela_A TaxID=3093743 RepID=UPI003BB62AFD
MLRGIDRYYYYYDLIDAQAIMVHDVRHLLGSGDISQPFQKIMGADDARLVLANEDLYAGSMGGFISQASDTSLLRTVDEIILGLRLDYVLPNNAGMPYRVGETEAVYAVRFHAQKAAPIHIPDYSNHLRVEELRRDRVAEQIREADGTLTPEDIRLTEQDIATYREHANTESGAGTLADRAEWPNTGHGLTSSRVDALPVVPELKVDRGVIMESGAEMWRIDRDGNEVLVGAFNQKTERFRGLW